MHYIKPVTKPAIQNKGYSYFVLYLMMLVQAASAFPITKVTADLTTVEVDDMLATEEPLEIRLTYNNGTHQQNKTIAVTMRTPGNDAELATGFLFTEGIITGADAIERVEQALFACAENRENTIEVVLKPGFEPNLHQADRNFYTTSSCGVCGKSSINAIRTVSSYKNDLDGLQMWASILHQLPATLRAHQEIFSDTGGLHASAIFDQQGRLLFVREDVGRHNALDKLIGAALASTLLPLNQHILLLSGRASFELIQKAAMAGIRMVAAVGAPSTLAVQLAKEFNITLIGFLRHQRFNIYTAPQRVVIE
ncbi:formate dehydrogenase accessory sulfurtransferase FdhD [Mucilaginibacter koreensis]